MEINPLLKTLFMTDFKVCELASKLKGLKPHLVNVETVKKHGASSTNVATGELVYSAAKKTPVIMKFFYTEGYKFSNYNLSGLNYEIDVYRYIRDNILMKNICPNFVAYLANGVCDQQTLSEKLKFDDIIKPSYVKNITPETPVGIVMLEYVKGKDTPSFLRENTPPEDAIVTIIFQIMYLCLVMEKFRIQHNDLHLSNIKIQHLRSKQILYYNINGTIYRLSTNYIVYVYDWDRAYVEALGDNISISGTKHQSILEVNKFIFKKDCCFVLNRMYYTSPEDTIQKQLFLNVVAYLDKNRDKSLLTNITEFELFDKLKIDRAQTTEKQQLIYGDDCEFADEFAPLLNVEISNTSFLTDSIADRVFKPLFQVLRNTQNLTITHCPKYTFEECSFLSNVKFLTLSHNGIKRLNLQENSPYLQNVSQLDITGNNVRDLEMLSMLPKLEVLFLSTDDNEHGQTLFEKLKGCENLSTLVIQNEKLFTEFTGLEQLPITHLTVRTNARNKLPSYISLSSNDSETLMRLQNIENQLCTVNEEYKVDFFSRARLFEQTLNYVRTPDSGVTLKQLFGVWKIFDFYNSQTLADSDSYVVNMVSCLLFYADRAKHYEIIEFIEQNNAGIDLNPERIENTVNNLKDIVPGDVVSSLDFLMFYCIDFERVIKYNHIRQLINLCIKGMDIYFDSQDLAKLCINTHTDESLVSDFNDLLKVVKIDDISSNLTNDELTTLLF